jgi:hypothetical protein
MAKAPLRYQLYALGGIVLFTAAFGAMVYGIRTGFGSAYVTPSCEQACRARGGQLLDVDYRMGKADHVSKCVCTNNVSIPSSEADTVATASAVVPLLMSVVMTGLIVLWLSKRRGQSA